MCGEPDSLTDGTQCLLERQCSSLLHCRYRNNKTVQRFLESSVMKYDILTNKGLLVEQQDLRILKTSILFN